MGFTALLAESSPQAIPHSISVFGEAEIFMEPDLALVDFAIKSQADTSVLAKKQNDEMTETLMKSLNLLGVPHKSVSMQNLTLKQNTSYDREARKYIDDGFIVERDFEVRIKDFNQLPELLDLVVAAGAERISGARYVLEDVQAAEELALKQAVANAQAKAEKMCSTLDVGLGNVLIIMEGHASHPVVPMLERMSAPMLMASSKSAVASSAGSELVPSGDIKVLSQVTVMFEIL